MRTIIRIVPRIPLGPYPQLWLCGQVGKAPTSKIMIIISTISPIFISFCRTLGVQPGYGYFFLPCIWLSEATWTYHLRKFLPPLIRLFISLEVGLPIPDRRLGMGRAMQRQFIYFQWLLNSFSASSLVMPYLSWILPTS